MKVLGLDPGSRTLGYGLIIQAEGRWHHLASGTLVFSQHRSLAARLLDAHREIRALLLEHVPERVALEECFVAQSPRAALVLGQVRGVLMLAAEQEGVRLFEYAPRAVKLAAVGNGGAAKQQIQYMVPRLLRDCPPSLQADQADALAVAWCCALHGEAEERRRIGSPRGAPAA